MGLGPSVPAVDAGGVVLRFFGSFAKYFSFLSPSFFRETARYRLMYCVKEALNPKQPTRLFNNVPNFDHRVIKMILTLVDL